MEAGRGQDRESDASGTAAGGGGSSRRRRWIWGLVIGGVAALGLLFLTLGAVALILLAGSGDGAGGGGGEAVPPETFRERYVSGRGSDKIAVVSISGTIGAESATSVGVPAATPETLRAQLRQAAEDDRVRAVVLEINSPGGGVVASEQMYQAVLDFRAEANKPVVVSMGETAASGGYYVATAADEIVAYETTLTGSLGVIFSYLNLEEAAEKLGVQQEVIKSGEFKDIGSATREPTEEELEILQEYVDEGYDRFVKVIVEGRDLPEERVRELADGRVYSGLQAEALGLVDGLGDLERAAELSGGLAGVDQATVVRYEREQGLAELFRARLAGPSEPEASARKVLEEAGLKSTPELQYLYRP